MNVYVCVFAYTFDATHGHGQYNTAQRPHITSLIVTCKESRIIEQSWKSGTRDARLESNLLDITLMHHQYRMPKVWDPTCRIIKPYLILRLSICTIGYCGLASSNTSGAIQLIDPGEREGEE